MDEAARLRDQQASSTRMKVEDAVWNLLDMNEGDEDEVRELVESAIENWREDNSG